MKKILSLFCTLAIVLSATAAPLQKQAGMEKFARKYAKEAKAQKDFAPAKAAKAVSAADFKKKAALSQGKMVKAVARAQKAKAEAQAVVIGSIETEDWGTDVQYYLYSEDNTVAFLFDVYYAEGLTDVEPGKKYTLDDMDVEYSGVFYEGEWHGLAAAEFTKTIDLEGLTHIVGSCADSSNAAFTFTYDEVPFAPTDDTIAIALEGKARFTYFDSYGQWHVYAEDEKYAFSCDYYSTDVASPVNIDSIDYAYCHVDIYNALEESWAQIAPHEDNVELEISQIEDTIFVAVGILGEDGNYYAITSTFVAPKKEKEATITAENLTITVDDYYFFYDINYTAYTDKYGVVLQASSASGTVSGDFTIGNELSGYIYLFSETDTTFVEIYSGAVTVVKDGLNAQLTGKVLAYDNTEYTLNLTAVAPATLTGSDFELEIYDDSWMLSGVAEEGLYLSINGLSTTVAGTYTAANLDDYFTYVSPDGQTYYDMSAANLVVTYENNVITVKGSLTVTNEEDDTDVLTFDVDITGTYTAPTERHYQYDEQGAFGEKFPTYTIDTDYLEQYGVLYIDAENDNNASIALAIYPKEGETELSAGVYNVDGSSAPGTIMASTGLNSNGYLTYSLAGYLGTQGYTNVWFIVAGQASINANGVIELQGLNSNGQEVNARLGEYAEAIDNVATKAAATKRVVNGTLVIEKNGVLYNAQGAVVK